MNLEYTVRPRTIGLLLGILALYLAAQSLFGEYLLGTTLAAKADSVPGLLLDLFSVNAEQTIPTWYSVCLLLIASALLAVIAVAKYASEDRYRLHWLVLAFIFLYLSMDEGAVIHEIMADALQAAFNTTGFLLFGWQIVAVPLVILFALLYVRFLLHLPARTRNGVLLAGVLYVGGALLVEAVSADQLSRDRVVSVPYLAIGTLEELLEMVGVVTFIYTLLSYIEAMQYRLVFRAQSIALKSVPPNADTLPIQSANKSSQVRWALKLAALVVVLIAGANFALVSWALAQPPSLKAETTNAGPIVQIIVDRFPANDLQITHMSGLFSAENLTARQFVASLMTVFDQVVVITFPTTQSSIIIAGDTLPFDRTTLAEILHASGETQFVIYDVSAVRAIAGEVLPILPK